MLLLNTHLWLCELFSWSSKGFGVNELLYFRVISPEEIAYIFSAAPAKDFGGVFVSSFLASIKRCTRLFRWLTFFPDRQTSSYEEIFLIPADPADGCSEFKDQEIIQGQVVLLERGYVLLLICLLMFFCVILRIAYLFKLYSSVITLNC